MLTGIEEVLVPLGVSMFAGVVWLIRLEGRINYLEKTLSRVEIRHDDIMDKLSIIEKSISKLEGLLSREPGVQQ